MDRDIPNDEREPEKDGQEARGANRSRNQEPRQRPDYQRRSPSVERPARQYDLSDTQRQTMAEIGRFRTLSTEDLAEHEGQLREPAWTEPLADGCRGYRGGKQRGTEVVDFKAGQDCDERRTVLAGDKRCLV